MGYTIYALLLIEIFQEGLKNMFSRAGRVKKARVMETRNPNVKGTFG